MEKYQVIFYDDYEEVPYTEQYFDSKIEAEKWAEEMEFDEQDIRYNSQTGDDEYYTKYSYHNPQDKQNYSGYTVEPIIDDPLNEEFLRMQKLAGLITEEEYQSKSQELDLVNLSDKITKKWDIIKQHIKNQGYDI
jgi:hypothetical protein